MSEIKNREPLVSVIIVNWNGRKWLKKCLDSLCAQTYKNFEIIFVDNGSSDDSVEFIKKNYSQVVVVQSDTNRGFAGGNNLGIKHSNGSFILFLNTDTWVDVDFLKNLVIFYVKNSYDVIAPIEARYDTSHLKSYIMTMDIFGHGFGIHGSNKPPFYLSGSCLLFSRKAYDETGGLDENFFMYCEELDWFWRLQLFKKTFSYADDVFVFHAGAGSTGSNALKYKVFLWRNQNTLQMLLKNYSWYNLLWILPTYLLQNVFEAIIFLFFLKPKIAGSYVEGWWFNIKQFPIILKKRKWIQDNRAVGDWEMIKKMYFGFGKFHHLFQKIVK